MRAITDDSNLFKEAIIAFDKTATISLFKIFETNLSKRIYGYLILDFNLSKDMVFDDFTIHKSIVVDLDINNSGSQQVKKAFVSPVWMPERINFVSSHLYTLALSAICSFAFERPVHSTKNDNFNGFEIPNIFALKSVGVEFPTTVAGSSAVKVNIHPDIILLWEKRLKELINLIDILLLQKKGNKKLRYDSVMRSFRLIQLAHLNRKEDFDLGYSFLIAGTESVSQTIKRKTSNKHATFHDQWKELGKTNNLVKTLFEEYARLKMIDDNEANRDLGKRFAEFVMVYNKDTNWEEVLYDELITEGLNVRQKFVNEISVQHEYTPSDFSSIRFAKIIKDTYALRSKFFHTGLALPHTKTSNSFSIRYFQIVLNINKINELDKKKSKERETEISEAEAEKQWFITRTVLVTYELMSTMSRVSITNYLKEELINSTN
ncbi:MAG: hypothetical protein ABI892_17280 [Flavobacterium sp.]